MAKKKINLKSTRVDLAKEREGDWVRSIRFEGVRYYLKSTNNPAYAASLSAETRSLNSASVIAGREVDVDDFHRMRAKLVCAHILLAWDGFDEDYTADRALEELMDLGARPLLDDILDCATLVGRQELKSVEIDAKN